MKDTRSVKKIEEDGQVSLFKNITGYIKDIGEDLDVDIDLD